MTTSTDNSRNDYHFQSFFFMTQMFRLSDGWTYIIAILTPAVTEYP